MKFSIFSLILFSCVSSTVIAQQEPTAEWIRQWGREGRDESYSVASDPLGNVYVTGYSDFGEFQYEAFLRKYDPVGDLLWEREFGGVSGEFDRGFGVWADGLQSVYLVGETEADRVFSEDAFINKYDSSGNLEWSRLIASNVTDTADSITGDGLGNVYVSGYSDGNLDGNHPDGGGYVRKYDTAGNALWTWQLEQGELTGESLCCIGKTIRTTRDVFGNLYAWGQTRGEVIGGTALGKTDAYVGKFTPDGELDWIRQFGTSEEDRVTSVIVEESGDLYVTGRTEGDLGGPSQGNQDVFLRKYDASGSVIWTRQIGTSEWDWAGDLSLDQFGSIFVSGTVWNPNGTPVVNGEKDAFLIKYDANGTHKWTHQFGSQAEDGASDVATDGMGNIYVAGVTHGNFGQSLNGLRDAYLIKFKDRIPIPEPSSGVLLLVVAGVMGTRIRNVSCSKRSQKQSNH